MFNSGLIFCHFSVTGAILVALSSSGKDDEDDVKNGAILGAVLALGGSIL